MEEQQALVQQLATIATQQKLIAIWQELLDSDLVGVRDNFFEAGGDSLLMTQLRNKVLQTFGRDLTTVEIFKYPTIQAMAAHLDEQSKQAGKSAKSSFRNRSAARAKAKRRLKR